jgi:hypothetical protein
LCPASAIADFRQISVWRGQCGVALTTGSKRIEWRLSQYCDDSKKLRMKVEKSNREEEPNFAKQLGKASL